MTLALHHISKHFGGVKALHDVSLTVGEGQVHAICGENGAGKSTLMNIIAGNVSPDSGEITINGRPTHIKNIKDALTLGIAIVYQHLSVMPTISVAENIFSYNIPTNKYGLVSYRSLVEQTRQLLLQLDIVDVAPTSLVSSLSPAQKQLVEIAKALAKKPRVLILDEPTASISDRDAQRLFAIIRKLKSEGVTILYISHRLAEIFTIADTVSVLKDGRSQGTYPIADLTREQLIRLMVGRDIQRLEKGNHRAPRVMLEVDNLSGDVFHNISFKLYAGEILGVAGLVGAGRTEIAKAIFGAGASSGSVRINGQLIKPRHSEKAVSHGLAYVPEDRKTEGLFAGKSVTDNILIAAHNKTKMRWFNDATAVDAAESYRHQLRIVCQSVSAEVATLSGGNQQKVLLARWLSTHPDVLIVDEPTHGVDIGAKFEIYSILVGLAAQGKGVIVISSELPELLTVCDRILVVARGKITGELLSDDATEEKIMSLATQ